jgi:hypothetical protein
MMDRTVFRLRVKQVGTVCDFELSWGKGQAICAQLNYPLSLTKSYEQWQKAYLNYYRHLRGRKVASGTGTVRIDHREELVKAEKKLLGEFQLGEFQLGEFQRWLLSPELVSIRSEIAKATNKPEPHWVEVFLTCTPLELAWLPWETWNIGTDLGTSQRIRIARTPANIRYEPVRPIRRKARILAILGDDTGLNFDTDREALRSLYRVAEVEFVGWNREKSSAQLNTPKSAQTHSVDANALKQEICNAIADARGWDILFFAGHSNESALMGGELGIAPRTSISIQEIADSLHKAKQQGLQFAIFNSCSGINIAESLINLGLSQVVVMREPIHNQVAQEFLVQFAKSLAVHKDVHEALLDACQFLKQQENRLCYPSAYLVPSLFRHPEAELFRIEPFGVLEPIKRWLPTRKEAQWLFVFLLLSLLPPVQNLLLEPRIWLQAVYRQVTFQVPSQVEAPLLLVQIDNTSLIADDIQQRYPLDYSYLAKVVQNLSRRNASLIGIDYLLDQVERQPQNSQKLRQSIHGAVEGGTWFVFGQKTYENPKKGRVSPQLASLDWSLNGNIEFYTWYVELLSANTDCSKTCPFAYFLALAHSLKTQESPPADLPKPNLKNQKDFPSLVMNSKNGRDDRTAFLYQLRLPRISNFFQWFHPIIDFSIPPERAYQSISACELLKTCEGKANVPENLDRYAVIIAPGGYEEAGLTGQGGDNYTMPLGVAFWRGWSNGKFSGGEAHAYMLHHLLTRRLVVPVPDFWMILLAALLGKGMTLILRENPTHQQRLVMRSRLFMAVYVIVCLQIYISVAVLIPWFLPSVVFWNSIHLALRKKLYVQS